MLAWLFSTIQKAKAMKPERNNSTKQNKQGLSKKPKPEIRDDLDSRKEKQRNYKSEENKKGHSAK
jgi:hypothetical protein